VIYKQTKGVAWQPEQREENLSRPFSPSLLRRDAACERRPLRTPRVQVSGSRMAQSYASAGELLSNSPACEQKAPEM